MEHQALASAELQLSCDSDNQHLQFTLPPPSLCPAREAFMLQKTNATSLSRRGVFALCLLVLIPTLGFGQASCLQLLLNRMAPSGCGHGALPPPHNNVPYVLAEMPGEIPSFRWDPQFGQWRQGRALGYARGMHSSPVTCNVWLFTQAIDASFGHPVDHCSPAYLAKVYRILAHERLHWDCPEHESGNSVPGSSPPSGQGPLPDCNDINYAIHAGAAICDEIARVNACCSGESNGLPGSSEGYSDPADPISLCDGLKDGNGDSVPGLERGNLAEYCAALESELDILQDRWNTASNADTAYSCACEEPPWSGGGDCPGFPAPPGGCEGGAAGAYPGNEVIPECDQGCTDC